MSIVDQILDDVRRQEPVSSDDAGLLLSAADDALRRAADILTAVSLATQRGHDAGLAARADLLLSDVRSRMMENKEKGRAA